MAGVLVDKAGFKGRALGEGGMAKPSLGVLALLWFRLPGIGGLRSGAGEDMLIEFTGGGRRGDDVGGGGVVGGSLASGPAGIWLKVRWSDVLYLSPRLWRLGGDVSP